MAVHRGVLLQGRQPSARACVATGFVPGMVQSTGTTTTPSTLRVTPSILDFGAPHTCKNRSYPPILRRSHGLGGEHRKADSASSTMGERGSSPRPSYPPTEPIPSSPLLRSPQDARTEWNDCIKLHRVRTVAVRYILAARSITPLRLRNLIGLAAGMIDQDEWEVHLQRCPLRPASCSLLLHPSTSPPLRSDGPRAAALHSSPFLTQRSLLSSSPP